jgi:hypothetical protein
MRDSRSELIAPNISFGFRWTLREIIFATEVIYAVLFVFKRGLALKRFHAEQGLELNDV